MPWVWIFLFILFQKLHLLTLFQFSLNHTLYSQYSLIRWQNLSSYSHDKRVFTDVCSIYMSIQLTVCSLIRAVKYLVYSLQLWHPDCALDQVYSALSHTQTVCFQLRSPLSLTVCEPAAWEAADARPEWRSVWVSNVMLLPSWQVYRAHSVRLCCAMALLLLSVMRTDGGENEAAGSLEMRTPSYCMCQDENSFHPLSGQSFAFSLTDEEFKYIKI